MAFCPKCGTQVDDGAAFCPSCGNVLGQQQAPQGGFNPQSTVSKVMDTADTTAEFDPADINQNKAMAILSYLGILVLIPIFAAKNSKYARYHANQGLVLLITEVILSLCYSILTYGIIYNIFTTSYWGIRTVNGFGIALGSILGLAVSVVSIAFIIIGIINANKGVAKELPIIGKFKILK